jgi:predicted transcriptional regulator
MSHSVEIPDNLYQSLREIAQERGTDPVEAIEFALNQTYGRRNGRNETIENVEPPKTLGEKLRRSMVIFAGRPGTERLSEQRFEMAQEDIDRKLGR